MTSATIWETAADLQGLIREAAALQHDARTDTDAAHGLAAVLSAADRLAADMLSKAEAVERKAA